MKFEADFMFNLLNTLFALKNLASSLNVSGKDVETKEFAISHFDKIITELREKIDEQLEDN